MSMPFRAIICLLLSCVFIGCETTESTALKKLEEQRRYEEAARLRAEYLVRIHEAESAVWDILHPLMQKAADYREQETFGYIGAVFVSEAFYSEFLLLEVRAEGLGPFVSTLGVHPDSPAELAGLKAGDRLVSINDVKIPKGTRSAQFANRKVKRLLKPGIPNRLVVDRGGELHELEVTPVKGSYYGVVVMPGQSMDLHVDGDVIWMSLRLIETLDDSDELSYICAYALAKSVMRHAKQKGTNEFLGQIVDIAAMVGGMNTGGLFGSMGGGMYAHGFEVEADLIALYLLASSGYQISEYPDFWDKHLRARSKKGTLKKNDQDRLDIARQIVVTLQAKLESGEIIFPKEYLSGNVSEIELSEGD